MVLNEGERCFKRGRSTTSVPNGFLCTYALNQATVAFRPSEVYANVRFRSRRGPQCRMRGGEGHGEGRPVGEPPRPEVGDKSVPGPDNLNNFTMAAAFARGINFRRVTLKLMISPVHVSVSVALTVEVYRGWGRCCHAKNLLRTTV